MDKRKILNNYFADEDLVRIQNAVRDIEENIKGELKVTVRIKKPWYRFRETPENLARNEFIRQKLAYHETPGILIYILLSEKVLFLLFNEYLKKHIPSDEYTNIADKIQNNFRNGYFTNGIIEAIESFKIILQKYLYTETEISEPQQTQNKKNNKKAEASFSKVDFNWLWQN